MSPNYRAAGLIFLSVVGGLLAATLVRWEHLRAAAPIVPVQATQGVPPSSEPPLAGTAPRVTPVPAPTTPLAAPVGTEPATPAVALHVRVPASAAVGQELEYHLSIQNCSRAAAHHVIVRNPLPANARFVRATPEPTTREPELLWHIGSLAPCASREIVLVLAPTGTGDVRNCARVQFEHGQCVTTRISRPNLRLRKSGPAQAVLYDVLTYRLDVINAGETAVTDIQLTDTLPEGLEHSSGKNTLTWQIGTLAPGQTRSVDYQVVAKTTGRLCNRAAVTAAGGLREQADSCVTIGEARLTLAVTGPAQNYVNLPTTYQLTVSNPGTAPVENVVLSNPIPSQMSFLNAGHGGRLVGNAVQWALGTLAAGATRTVDITLRPQGPGNICNEAQATATRGLSAQAKACTNFVGQSALQLDLMDTVDPVEVGGQTSYVVTIRNTGTDRATNVKLVATVPDQLAVSRVTGPADNHKVGTQIEFDALTLPAGGQARFEIFVKAVKPGDVRFKVALTADQLTPGRPVHREESTNVYTELAIPPGPPAGGLRPIPAPRP